MVAFELISKQECLQSETGCSAEVFSISMLAGDATSPEDVPTSDRSLCLGSHSGLMYIVQHKHFLSSKQLCFLILGDMV